MWTVRRIAWIFVFVTVVFVMRSTLKSVDEVEYSNPEETTISAPELSHDDILLPSDDRLIRFPTANNSSNFLITSVFELNSIGNEVRELDSGGSNGLKSEIYFPMLYLDSPAGRYKRDYEEDVEEVEYDLNDSYYYNYTDENDTMDAEHTIAEIQALIFPTTWTWLLILFHFLVFVIGLVGNTLVCVAVYRNHTMRTVTNYFIVNLAVADFLVILFCLPPTVVWDVTMTWFFGVAMCKVVLYLQSVSVTVSVLTLTFISIDRWYAICFPLKFKSTTGRAKTAIWIIWIVALACDIPELIYSTTRGNDKLESMGIIYFTQCEPSWSKETDKMFVIVKMILFYLLPLLFMSIAYLQIIRVLWKSGNAQHQAMDLTGCRQVNTFAMNMNASTEGQLRSRRKAAKMLVAVVVMFAFCYFPVHLLSLLRLITNLKPNEGNKAFSLISHWLCYANSAVNPIIYNFMSGKFRKEFRRAFEHCCQRSSGPNYQFSASYHKSQNKDSGIASRSQSRTDLDIHRLTNDHFESRHSRRGTKTSLLRMDI